MTEQYIRIGFTKKTHGARGEVKITVDYEFLEDLLNSEVVFIPIKGKPLPFFIEEIRETNAILLKVEGIDSPKGAIEIASKDLMLRKQDITASSTMKKISGMQYAFLTGYRLKDIQYGEIGTILEVLEFPQQEMAVVNYLEKEIYIPLNDSFIQEINESKKEILISLPEGLLDI